VGGGNGGFVCFVAHQRAWYCEPEVQGGTIRETCGMF